MSIRNHIFKLIFDLTLKVRRENFYSILESYEKSQYFPQSDLEDLQLKKLQSLVTHAKNNVPYYKSKLPQEINCLSDLSTIPLLDKDSLRSDYRELYVQHGSLQRTKTSGGSTGAPISIIKNSEGVAQEMAAAWRGYSWAGIKPGDRQARFWGAPRNTKEKYRAKIIDFICHRVRIVAFGYDEKTFDQSLIKLKNFKPEYFYGYTSIIEELSTHINNKSQETNFNLKSIITTSEALSKPTRSAIEKAFKTKVFDEYGCGEVGTIAHECEQGNLHLNMENSIIEILDSNGSPLPPGNPGEIVVTDLTNYSMPLIRYRIKDYGVVGEESCACGRKLKILKNVFGRQYDALTNSEGKKFHGEFFLYIAEDAKKAGHKISGIQFIQKNKNTIEIDIVSPEKNTELYNFIESRILKDFDPNFNLKFNWKNEIAREPSGKLRVVINETNL